MRNLKKVLIAIALPIALLGSSVSFAADLPGEQFVITNPPTSDRYTGVNLADDNAAKNTFSALEAFTANGTTRDASILTRQTCQQIGTKGCEADKYFQYNAQLGMCNSTVKTDCVTRVFARDSSGKEVEGTFVENFPGNTEFSYPGDPSIGLPAGTSPFVVDFPSHPHAGGTLYLVVLWLQGARGFKETQFSVENFSTGIFAVSKVNGNYSMARPADNEGTRPDHKLGGRQSTAGGFNMDQSSSRRSACVQTSKTQCLLPWPMPLDVSFGFTVKLHEKITGWLHGRIADAQAEITKSQDGDQLLTIAGKPTQVPGIFAWFKKDSYPASLKSYYAKQDEKTVNSSGLGWPKPGDESSMGPDGLPWSIMKENFGYDEGGFAETLAWIAAVSDKAQYAQTVWSAKSLKGQYEQCMKGSDSLSGIVTTNSTMYIGSPPTFDQASQSLDYKVVSPHYLPSGEEFKGSYDLVIKSEVARCIYGFSSAPVSAKISILSADGTTQVATTTFNERNGWMHLIARGFTFSSPTVRVKLMQEGSKPVAAPKVTITCVKGKSIKKLTAIKPACPSGWKKK